MVSGYYTAANCAADGINDLGGETAANAPEFSATLSGQYDQGLGSFELTYVLDLIYTESSFMQGDLDPVLETDSTVVVNATVRLSQPGANWNISLVGKNLTDESEYTSGNDNALITGSSFAGIMPPRNLSITASYRF